MVTVGGLVTRQSKAPGFGYAGGLLGGLGAWGRLFRLFPIRPIPIDIQPLIFTL